METIRGANWHINFTPALIIHCVMTVSRYEVLRVFATSKERGTAIGIRIKGRNNLLITTLCSLSGRVDEDTVLELNNLSIYGEPVESTQISLVDVEGIFNLRVRFDDPFYSYLRSLRNNIRNIRAEVGFEKVTVIR
jgi:hypothetical protein